MEIERGGYHELQRLRFKMDISLILVLTIAQNTYNQSNSFLIVVQLIVKPFL